MIEIQTIEKENHRDQDEDSQKGYPVMELDGGWRWWTIDGFEIEK